MNRIFFVRFLFVILSTTFATQAMAQFNVIEVNDSKSRAKISGPLNELKESESLEFTDGFEDKCVAKIVKINTNNALIDISGCKNKSTINSTASFKKFDPNAKTEAKDSKVVVAEASPTESGTPTINEDWYFLLNFGAANINYENANLEKDLDALENINGVDRSQMGFDLGFYWPTKLNEKHMHGFLMSYVSDTLEDSINDTLTVTQSLLAYSYTAFYGENIGDGWFWKADIGLALHSIRYDGVYGDLESDTESGLGLQFGGGYSFPIGTETRMSVGAYASIRNAEPIDSKSMSFLIGFLF